MSDCECENDEVRCPYCFVENTECLPDWFAGMDIDRTCEHCGKVFELLMRTKNYFVIRKKPEITVRCPHRYVKGLIRDKKLWAVVCEECGREVPNPGFTVMVT